jgi:hypothetical protein
VRFLLTGPGYSLPAPWERVHTEPRLALWRDPTPRPLFFSPASLTAAASERTALEIATWSLPVAKEASVEDWRIATRSSPAILVRKCVPVNNGFDLLLDAPEGGVLVSSVAFVRGWKASSDDGDSAVLRVNGGFLGLALSPGVSQVRLRYAPPGWRTAKLLATLGIVALTMFTLACARSRDHGFVRPSSSAS